MSAHQRGTVLGGRFELVRPLGAGGMASVWEAIDDTNGASVALKILHPKLAEVPEAVRRIEREATLLIALRHPNIAACIAPSIADDTIAIAMELVEGQRLDHAIGDRARRNDPWSLTEIRPIFEKLCHAVSHAHAHGVLHRDLKPHNLMLVDDPEVRIMVLDFGVAKILATGASDATTQGRRLGSLNYAAPEQQRGDPADERADIFALGVILFESLTFKRAWVATTDGRRPTAFSGKPRDPGVNDLIHVLERMSDGPRPQPTRHRSELPEALDDVVAKATAAHVDDRYDSVASLLAAFLDAVGDTVPARIMADAAPTVARTPSDSDDAFPTVVRSEVQITAVGDTRLEPQPALRRSVWPWVTAVALASATAAVVMHLSKDGTVANALVKPVERVEVEVEARPRIVVEAKSEPTREAAPPPVAPPPVAPPPKRTPRRVERAARPPDPPKPAPTVESIEALRDRILRRAKRISDADTRMTIERIATTSAMAGDRAGLQLALQTLEKSERAQAAAP